MSEPTNIWLLIGAMTAAAAFCRLAGFAFMGYVPRTPRIEAALRALPLGVMIGLLVQPALRGGVPEVAGIAVIIALTRLGLNDLLSTMGGLIVIALLRAWL